MIDPVELTAELIRCPSITPEEGGAIQLLETRLKALGFAASRCDREGIANLHARIGEGAPVFGFAGHTDVVPPGDPADWTRPVFRRDRRGRALGTRRS